jgi:hypothetical protein
MKRPLAAGNWQFVVESRLAIGNWRLAILGRRKIAIHFKTIRSDIWNAIHLFSTFCQLPIANSQPQFLALFASRQLPAASRLFSTVCQLPEASRQPH